MRLDHLWLTDFRSYGAAALDLAPEGLTVVVGPNGTGKTNLLEAIGYVATLSSFRGAPKDAMVRSGAAEAVVRAEGERDGRRLLVEATVGAAGRDRVLVNRQPLRRGRDLLGALRVSVFAPDDLVLVKGGPGERRRYLDELLVALHPKHDELQATVDRVLRQRGALLRSAGGRLSPEVASTLDVWDAKLAAAGSSLAEERENLVDQLRPAVLQAYRQVAGQASSIEAVYQRSWSGSLADALADARSADLRRVATTVGPHRDDVVLRLNGLSARTHSSQGEQRSLALALRLGGHLTVTEAVGEAPLLLLDDVFSELDTDRSRALVAGLPDGQAVLTTAGELPQGATAAAVVRIHAGELMGAA